MNSSIASANNATLATVATYALKSVVDQLALDVAARQTAADVDQRVATALLSYLTQTAYQAGQALQDARLDGHDADILALQNAGPYATGAELTALQVSLQSAIDGILAEIATLGGATNLVNAPAWVGEITWDLLVGTNQIRNLHAVAPLSIALANDNWTLSLSCGYYTTQEADDAVAAALTNHFTRAEATANFVAFLAQANSYTDDQLLDYSTTVEMNQAIADALVPLTLSNGQNWNGGPTFNLLRGTNVLRNLSVAGALTATFQNLDDTILIESDSYARGETYTQAETGAAITAAIDALDLSQFRNEAQVLALIAGELGPYWDQAEVSSFVAGELSNYQTGSQVSSAISSALSSYDDSSQVDSKIVTALLDFYNRAETDQAIADAASSSVDLSAYYTSAQTDMLFYPRTELDLLLTATLTQYWTSGRTQTEIDDALAGSGFLDLTGIWCEPRARISTWCRSSSRPTSCGTYFLKPRWWATPSSATSPRSASEATPGPRPRRTPASCGRMIWVRWTPVTSQTPRAPRAAAFSIWFRPSSLPWSFATCCARPRSPANPSWATAALCNSAATAGARASRTEGIR